MSYQLLLSLHLIAIISWMAGMLYLPRLFVYHAGASAEVAETLKVMERRLYKFIMTPAMIASYVFGIWMISQNPAYMSMGWLHAKILFVLCLSGVHGYLGGCLRRFANDQNKKSAKFYRVLNEIPTVLMIVIVFLVVFKAF